MSALEVKSFKKSYGNVEAVRGISFTVKEGEIFGLIGPNGAGKTTTIRTIATLIQINEGEISVFGMDVGKEPAKVRQIISYLPEDAGAYKDHKGDDYLKFIAGFFADGSEREAMIEKGRQIANLDAKLKNKISTYSKGMIRRLLVARALMVQPKLAILDEPTSGLDVINATQIRKIIKETKNTGSAVLLSSHNMLEVEFLCDRIALINNGKIIETGTPKELKEKYNAANIEEVFMGVINVK